MFDIISNEIQEAVIKVIGVGGCGSNAVDHMISEGVDGVEFIAANTDAQALELSKAPVKLQLGTELTRGLGAGADPERGRLAAEEDREKITELLEGADMVFIAAGMGGGTGTGAAPVVAQVAKSLGILTVAVVTKPFVFEGKRQKTAKEGIAALTPNVDSLIVIPNEKLMQVLGDDVTVHEAFHEANNVLKGAVGGIAEIINCPGLVNVDFADVKKVMSAMGMAMMGSAVASGPHRAKIAAEAAVKSPLLEDVSLAGAKGVLVNITASSKFKMKEMHDVMNVIKGFTQDDEIDVFVGNVFDESMGEDLRVTVVATGLGTPARSQARPLAVVRTGTDNAGVSVEAGYARAEQPAVIRRNREQVDALRQSGVEHYDIPAFLRKQAD